MTLTKIVSGGQTGEAGRIFDATLGRVEPAERPTMGEQHCGERRYTDVSAGPRTKQDSAASGPG